MKTKKTKSVEIGKFPFEGYLFDDDSVKKKLEVMSKWDAIIDDERNQMDDIDGQVNQLLQLGKKYRFTLIVEVIGKIE